MKRLAGLRLTNDHAVPAAISRHTSLLVLLGVLLGQLLLLSVQITRNQNVRLIQVWAAEVFGPFERGFHEVVQATGEAWSAIHDLRVNQEENRELGRQLVIARARIQELSAKAAEANHLRALLDFKTHLAYRSVAAEVIASSPGQSSTAVLIDRGRDAGLTPDLPVVTPAGVVGKTVAVYPHTTQVLLITDPSCGVGCILGTDRTQGVLKGDGQNRCELQYVMDEEKVPVGEAVLTSGLDQIYPKGLLVGYVLHWEDGNIYKHIVVKPAISLSRLENVLILLNAAPTRKQALDAGHH